jgi:hypothetical protein
MHDRRATAFSSVEKPPMNNATLLTADLATHLKIIAIALAATMVAA